MSYENDKTIEVYEKYGDKYLGRNASDIKNNPRAQKDDIRQQELIREYITGLDKDAKIFEIGSASGRDAKTMEELGFHDITVSDVADYFINYLRDQGFSPLKFNLITDDFPNTYDFIFCWAVLVHFTKPEAISAMQKIYRSLNTNGRFAFCVKHKDGHEAEWEDYQNKIGAKRYFSYWDKDELEDAVRKIGFKNVRIYQYGGARACWLQCYAEK